jgi:hypothetical protein
MVAVAAKMEEILSAQTLMIFGMLFRRFALHNAKSCKYIENINLWTLMEHY